MKSQKKNSFKKNCIYKIFLGPKNDGFFKKNVEQKKLSNLIACEEIISF